MNIEKYAEELKGVKDIPEGDLDNLMPEPIKPLLVIELESETSVPKVFYQGEEITGRKQIEFGWKTKRGYEGTGGMKIYIEYADKEAPTTRIEGMERGEYETAEVNKLNKLNMLDAFDDEQQRALIESVIKHNLGSDQLAEIAKISAELGDCGVSAVKLLRCILEKYKKDNYLKVSINE